MVENVALPSVGHHPETDRGAKLLRRWQMRKRLFDLVLASLLLPVLVPLMALVLLAVMLTQGRPYFYRGERMKTPTQSFMQWKFRTMAVQAEDDGVTGGHKARYLTRLGLALRRTRLDELPQIWNILRGDMSFVGPRPQLRAYVERYPDLYAQVLRIRPGVTGLASLLYFAREEAVLADCLSAEEVDQVYSTVCMPVKARLDILYQRKASLRLDLVIIFETLRRVVLRDTRGMLRGSGRKGRRGIFDAAQVKTFGRANRAARRAALGL